MEKGDIRLDGKIFYTYDKGNEVWCDDVEHFNARKSGAAKDYEWQKEQAARQGQENRVWKRGDIGPDGRRFKKYRSNKEMTSRCYRECWFPSEESYQRYYENSLRYTRKYRADIINREGEAGRKRLSEDTMKARENTRAKDPILFKKRELLKGAKRRAYRNNLPFNLELEDIIIPEVCPIMKLPFDFSHIKENGAKPLAPSLDRLIPSKGYTKGNVFVIAWEANAKKRNSTLDELKALVTYYETNLPKAESPE